MTARGMSARQGRDAKRLGGDSPASAVRQDAPEGGSMTVSKPETVEVTQALEAIPGDIWDAVDKIAGPNGNTHREWAQVVDRLRCALAEEMHSHRLNATPSRLREAMEHISDVAAWIEGHGYPKRAEDLIKAAATLERCEVPDGFVCMHEFAALSDTPPPDNEETEALRDALANDNAWVCAGIPDEAIEAGIAAWRAADVAMEEREHAAEPEDMTDWDEGMIVAAIFKAVGRSLLSAFNNGGK